ncbi:MAG: hypothetical protein K940chlam3_01233 [Chlamydiae bacterium]|nr:hypothetical protein [Chlamydiota bacterium]
MLPILFVIQIVLISFAAKKTQEAGSINSHQRRFVNWILLALVIWGVITSYLSLNGFYHTEQFLSSLPGIWITQIAVLIVLIPWIFSQSFRHATNSIIDKTPLHFIMAFEGIRIAAIGGVIKGYRGEFSPFFAKTIGIPDFLIGIASLIAAYLIYKGVWKERSAIVINLLGLLVIVPFAMVFINLGLPGPMYLISETPSLSTIFDYPMALAPTLVVPIFVMVNLFVVIRLMTRHKKEKNYGSEKEA